MKLKDITELACVFLQKTELLDLGVFIDGKSSEAQEELKINRDLQLLNRCANLVYKEVACDYLPLQTQQVFETEDGILPYADFRRELQDVKSVTNEAGESVAFSSWPSHLQTQAGKVTVKYTYVPQDVGFYDELDYRSGKVSERVFSYGTACEYCLISGRYEDASVWEQRYKDALLCCAGKKAEIRLPRRRWA